MNRQGELDPADLNIVDLLRRDPRMANRALAAAIGVSVPTLYSRLRELDEYGVFEVRAQLDFSTLGYARMAFADVYVQGRSTRDVACDLAELDEVLSVLEFVEEPRLVVPLVAGDDAHLMNIAVHAIGAIAGVSRVIINVALQIEQYGFEYGEIGADRHKPLPVIAGHGRLDMLDQALVETLRTDARVTNRQVAEAVGISETNVRKRLGRLQDEGMFRFSLVCAPARIGLRVWAYVRLATRPDRLERIVAALRETPYSQSLILTSGQWNLHWFGLFPDEAMLNQLAITLTEIADHDIDIQVRRVHHVEKHNCDYVSII